VASRAEAARPPALRRSRLHEEPGCRSRETEGQKVDKLPTAEPLPRQKLVRCFPSARPVAAHNARDPRGLGRLCSRGGLSPADVFAGVHNVRRRYRDRRLARNVRDVGVAGSNRVTPTIDLRLFSSCVALGSSFSTCWGPVSTQENRPKFRLESLPCREVVAGGK